MKQSMATTAELSAFFQLEMGNLPAICSWQWPLSVAKQCLYPSTVLNRGYAPLSFYDCQRSGQAPLFLMAGISNQARLTRLGGSGCYHMGDLSMAWCQTFSWHWAPQSIAACAPHGRVMSPGWISFMRQTVAPLPPTIAFACSPCLRGSRCSQLAPPYRVETSWARRPLILACAHIHRALVNAIGQPGPCCHHAVQKRP